MKFTIQKLHTARGAFLGLWEVRVEEGGQEIAPLTRQRSTEEAAVEYANELLYLYQSTGDDVELVLK